jgi:lysophospholipase L1-like esterase
MNLSRTSRATVVLLLTLNACSGGGRSTTVPPTDNGAPTTLLVIGGSATEGDGVANRLRDAWPYLVFRDAFSRSTSLINAALDNATVANAHADQLPLVTEVKPDTVLIWLGVDDLIHRTPTAQFASQLRTLIDDARATGTRRILVADLPDALGNTTSAYNAALRQVVAATHTKLVELEHVTITLVPTDGLPPQPDAAGHRAIAQTFERALRTTP